jgi:large subunit ribosomal protein L21
MKYAILESGGKQYLAREGEMIQVDRLPDDVGTKIQWKEVLLVVDDAKVSVGTPVVKGATVRGTLVEQTKAPKILVFKYKSRERYRRRIGHRQKYSHVLIEKISVTQPRKKKEETESKASSTESKATGAKKASAKKAPAKKAPAKSSSTKKPSAKASSSKKSSTAKAASTKKTASKKKEPKK